MITKAIIKYQTDNMFGVRIPLFETAGQTHEFIMEATLAITPGNTEAYKPGDVVFVGFENNSLNYPVILGKLYVKNEDLTNINNGVACGQLKVNGSAKLPNNTTIGNVDFLTIYDTFMSNELLHEKVTILEREVDALIKLMKASGIDITALQELIDQIQTITSDVATTSDVDTMYEEGE